MTQRERTVSPVVRQKALHLGVAGEEWLAGLTDLIADLEKAWSIQVGEPLRGGFTGYVARARMADGSDAVVKVCPPDPLFAREVGTIAAARGRGYVELYAHDLDRRAMLLEALGPALNRTGLTPESQIEILCDLLRRAWEVPRDTGPSADPAVDKATALAESVAGLWEELDHPCPEHVVSRALQFAEGRAAAFDAAQCVVVHGDAAPANVLRTTVTRPGTESGFVFVDPDGFVGDPTYDLGVVLRDWCPELQVASDPQTVARRYSRLMATRSGMDESAIWEWGFLERVSTGLYALQVGGEELGRPHLTTAELLV
jgi:streptomycin 6-kinase